MVAVNEIRDVYRLEASSTGVDATAAAAGKLAAANDAVVVSSQKVEQRTLSVEKALQRFAVQTDAVAKAQATVARGQAIIDRAFEQGLAGTAAYDRAVSGLAEAEARLARAMSQTAEANDRAAASSRRLSDARRVLSTIEGSTGVRVDFGSAGRAEDIGAYGSELDRVRAKFNPLFAAGQAYKVQLAEIAQAARVGAISEAERSAALARTKDAFAAQVVALRSSAVANENGARATALHAGAWQSLQSQANDAITMILSGSSVFQVMSTQGGQVVQALQGPQGIAGGLKEVGNYLLGLITPARLLVGGLLAIGAVGITAALSWRSAQSDIQRALSGVARASGATLGDIEGSARATAQATGMSVSAARDLAVELAKTGRIARENLAPIAALGKNFGATFGLDTAESGQALAQAFAEPGKGAEDLARRYGLLSDATVQYIRHLEDSNERTRAQQVLIDAIRPKLINAAEATAGWAYAWDKVATSARNAWDWISKTSDRALGGAGGGTDEEQRAVLENRMRYLRSPTGQAASSRGGDLSAVNQQIADTQRQLDALNTRAQKARDNAADAAKNDLSLRAGLIVRGIAPEVQALDELIAKRKTLAATMGEAGSGPGDKAQAIALARLDAQIRDYTAAGGALELQERKRAAASQLVLDAQKARTPAEVGALAARRSLTEADGTATFAAERAAAAERARTEATAAAQKQIDDQAGAIDRSAASSNRIAEVWRISGEAAAMRGEAARKAAEDVERGLPAEQAYAREQAYLREQLAAQRKERAEKIAQMNAETAVEERLNQQVDRGAITREAANDQRQREIEVARLQAQAAAAEGEQRTTLLRQVDDLTGAYERQSKAKADAAAQSMLAEQDRTLAQLKLEAEMVGATRLERERALAVLRAQQDLQRQGIPLSGEKGQRYINGEALKAEMTYAKTEYERLAQEISSVVSGIFDDMFRAGNKGLSGFADSFSRGFARIGTRLIEQNLIAPMLSDPGKAAGNLFSGFQSMFDAKGMEKAVASGAEGGITSAFGDLLKPQGGGGFATSKLGGGLMSAGAGAAIGYQSQSPLMGALGGALAGLATGNPILAAVGAGAGLLGGLFGASKAREEQRKARQQQAQQNQDALTQARPQIDTLSRTLRGAPTSGVEATIEQARLQMVQAIQTAAKAGDLALATRLEAEWGEFAERMRAQVRATAGGITREIEAGFGTSGPFAQAATSVRQLGDTMRAWLDDVNRATDTFDGDALAAIYKGLFATLQPTPELSQTAREFARIMGTAAALQQELTRLSGSAEGAAAAIRDGVTKALDTLRASFNADLDTKINDARGQGYLNDVVDLLKEVSGLRLDASLVGGDLGKVDTYFAAAAQKIVTESQLTGEAFSALVTQYPALNGLVREYSAALADQASTLEQVAERIRGYQDRLFAATNDANTEAGALAAFQRQAEQDRAAEVKAGGQGLADLEKAQAAERLNIVRDFAERAAAAEKAIADRRLGYVDRLFAAGNDTTTLAGQLAAFDRKAEQERQAEIAAGGQAIADLEAAQYAERLKLVVDYQQQAADAERQRMEAAQQAFDTFARSIRTFVDGLRAGSSSPLAPQARLAAAQSQYDAQLALARSGDRTALDGITAYASDLLDAAKGFYASSAAFQTIFGQVTGQLSALPSQVSAEQFIVNAIDASKTATVNATQAMQAALKTAIDAGNGASVAAALLPQFNTLTATTGGLLNYGQFLSATGNLATVSEQQAARAIFNSIDADGDGQLSRLELIRAQAAATSTNTDQTRAAVDIQNQIVNGQSAILNSIVSWTSAVNNSTIASKNAIDYVAALNLQQKGLLDAINSWTAATNTNVNTGNVIANGQTGILQSLQALNQQISSYTNNTWTQLNGVYDVSFKSLQNLQAANGKNGAAVYASGGLVTGPGTGTSDSISARLSNGEYVLTAEATRRLGVPLLDALNENRLASLSMPALTMPAPATALPMPVPFVAGNDNGNVVAMLARVIDRIGVLEANLVAAETAGAEHVREGVDGVRAEQRRGNTDATQERLRPRRSGTHG